jgi:hypothetical protein
MKAKEFEEKLNKLSEKEKVEELFRQIKVFQFQKIINQSEMSRHITGGDRGAVRFSKIPTKHIPELDLLFNKEIPEWWQQFKKDFL